MPGKILIVGYGNCLRSDDGAGIYVVEKIARLDLPGVETRIQQQLTIELGDEVARYDVVVLVDASSVGPEVELRRVRPRAELPATFSHHLSPETLMVLVNKVYGVQPELSVCTVAGENFEFGTTLSVAATERADAAVEQITNFIRNLRQS